MKRWWLGLCGALALAACSEDPEKGVGSDDTGVTVDGGGDGAVAPDQDVPDAGEDANDGGEPVPDTGPRPDQGVVVPIATCTDACNQLAACEQLGAFGSYDTCLDACAESEITNDLSNFFACIEGEACNLVGRCRLPDPPDPPALTCAETCAQIDTCGLQLPGFEADCTARCEAFDRRAQLVNCVAPQVAACAPAAFSTCVSEQVFPACGRRCTATVACNIELADTCVADCVAAGLDADPLRRLRQNQRNTCVNTSANDCERINRCLVPQEQAGPVDEVTFCRRYSGCGFDNFFPCQDFVRELAGQIGAESPAAFLRCIYDSIEVCPRDPFQSLEQCLQGPGNGNAAACGDLCAARDVCGSLPEGQDRFGCTSACAAALQSSPDAAARQEAELVCGQAETCPDLAACEAGLDTGPVCAAHCAVLNGCGPVDPACEANCDAQFYRDRQVAVRACVSAAGESCAAVAACADGEPALCAARCARSVGCGLESTNVPEAQRLAACLSRCDDADFADHASTVRQSACFATAPVCYADASGALPSAQSCLQNLNANGGQACLGWCRLQGGCGAEGADFAQCVTDCADTLTGDDAVAVRLADACLGQQATGTCNALGACLVSAEPPCAAHCAAVAACDLDRPDCAAACEADPLAALRAGLDTPCLQAAGNDCQAAEACLADAESGPPPVDTSRAHYCALHNACGFGDLFDCGEIYDILNQESGLSAITCAVTLLEAGCPADPFETFNQCLRGNETDPRAERCLDLCDARAACDDLPDGQRDCDRNCLVVFAGAFDGGGGEAGGGGEPPPDFDGDGDGVPDIDIGAGGAGGAAGGGGAGGDGGQPDDVVARNLGAELGCLGSFTCADLADCRLNSAPATQCMRFCQARIACGEVIDEAACAAECDARFDRLRDTAWRTCVTGAGDDCQAVADCQPTQGPDCAGYCATLNDCGIGNGSACEGACDDAAFRQPVDQAVRVQCALAANACYDEGIPNAALPVDRCVYGDISELVPRSCQAWCRAVETCGGGERGLEACISQCVQGFDDPTEELRLAQATDCLNGVDANGACGPLQACVPAQATVNCAAHCATIGGCNIEAQLPCLAACRRANPPVEDAACVSEATRLGQGCVQVAACVGFEAPPASADCVGFCGEARRCDPRGDDFACRLTCAADPLILTTQRACRKASACGNWAICDALDGTPDAACADPCADLGQCGFSSSAQCVATCTGNRRSPDTDAAAEDDLVNCLSDAAGPQCTADAVQRCFVRGGGLCSQACDVLADCGFVQPGDDCIQGCEEAAASGEPSAQPDALQCFIQNLPGSCDPAIIDRCVQF